MITDKFEDKRTQRSYEALLDKMEPGIAMQYINVTCFLIDDAIADVEHDHFGVEIKVNGKDVTEETILRLIGAAQHDDTIAYESGYTNGWNAARAQLMAAVGKLLDEDTDD